MMTIIITVVVVVDVVNVLQLFRAWAGHMTRCVYTSLSACSNSISFTVSLRCAVQYLALVSVNAVQARCGPQCRPLVSISGNISSVLQQDLSSATWLLHS